jgi:hypothetical protein
MTLAAMPNPLCAPTSSLHTHIDQTKTSNTTPELCYWCHQFEHVSQDCPLHYDVHHLTIDEEDDMVEHILVNHNATIAATAVLSHLSEGAIIECKVNKEDFVWSSR